jgi:hypothetical protein
MKNSIDHLLREALNARAAATPSTSCLDAETAAALADGTLSAHERSGAEAHVADCARCQALLATLTRLMPPPVVRVWWRRPAIAWLVPLTVAATVAIVWVTVPRRTDIEPPVQSVREQTRSRDSESRGTPSQAATAELQSQSAGDVAARSATSGPVPKRERDRPTPGTDVPAATQSNAIADSRAMATPPAPDAPAAAAERAADAPLPSRSLPQIAAVQPSVPSVGSGSRRTAPAEPAPEHSLATESVTETTQATGRMLAMRGGAARELVVVSSNPISRWRIGTGGVVQHSADGGSTWQTQSTGVNVTLTAGSSPSPSVCWLVGPVGVVLISTDEGRSWQRAAFPVAIDLISVRATDDKTATVVTADDRTFTTSDRGRTWRR